MAETSIFDAKQRIIQEFVPGNDGTSDRESG